MRILLISLAAAGSAVALASPASAQAYGNLGPYGAPAYAYGNGYGYGNSYGQVGNLQYRIDSIQRRIAFLDSRNVLSNREARRLRDESRSVEQRLRRAARYGLNRYEARDIEYRLAGLEQRVQREASDRNGRWGRYDGRYYGDRDQAYGRGDRWDRDDRDRD
jgi:hypothetical protein